MLNLIMNLRKWAASTVGSEEVIDFRRAEVLERASAFSKEEQAIFCATSGALLVQKCRGERVGPKFMSELVGPVSPAAFPQRQRRQDGDSRR